MENLFKTESETSDKEAENYKCVFCQKMYIDNTELIKHMELCDVEKTRKVRRTGKTSLVSSARNSLATVKKYSRTCRCTKLPRKTSLPSAENC